MMLYFITAFLNGFCNSVNKMMNVKAGQVFGAAKGALINYIEATILSLALVFLTRLLHVSSMNPQGETLVLVALIPAFAPAANVVAQFSQIYDLDAKYAGLINAVTMLLCIVTMPLLVAVYQM